MEYRKELSQKSKKLIREHLASDIFNTDTGYYKTENIFPVATKPNEYQYEEKEFIPKYKELKHYERNFNNNISSMQKHNIEYMSLKPNYNHKNYELEMKRNRSNDVKQNCYDQNGNFSAKKLYLLDVFGKENLNLGDDAIKVKRIERKEKNSDSKDMKENKNKNNKDFSQEKTMNEKKPNGSEILSFKHIFNRTFTYNKANNNNDSNNTTNNMNTLKNNLLTSYQKDSKISKNLDTEPNDKSYKIINKEINNNNNIIKINNNINKQNKIKYPKENILKAKSEKSIHARRKDSNKVIMTESYNPSKKIIKKVGRNEYGGQELFNIEIKNCEEKKNEHFLLDEKKVKHILYRNGLHIYDFNTDGMNAFFKDEKIAAKLRKNKNDENFEKNYRKAEKELNRYSIQMDKSGIVDGKGFQKEKKKRKGTPGRALHNNKNEDALIDKNTTLNSRLYFKKKYIK